MKKRNLTRGARISRRVMLSFDCSRGLGRAGLIANTGCIRGVRLAGWLLVACSLAFGQYPGQYPPGYPGGGYPPGQYPPGTYPPGQGPGGGIPIPSKGSKKPVDNAPLPSFRGYLKQMDDKTITIELDDHRELQFRRNGKTKFFKGGDEVKSPKFDMGDQLSIEGPQDPQGFFTAANVYWERGAQSIHTETASDSKGKDRGGAVDTWKDDPKKGSPDAKDGAAASKGSPDANDQKPTGTNRSPDPNDAPARPTATEVAPPSAPADADDPGRPKLVRGKAADPTREHAATVPDAPPPSAPAEEARNLPPAINTAGTPSILRGDEDPIVRRPAGDPLIMKATEAALDFTEGLPNYVCQEMMARYQSESHPANWQAIDVVGAAIVYEKGKEDYRDITINGKAIKKKMDQMEGSWSTGEFGTVLIDLLSPATAAQFRYRREERTSGVLSKVYDYTVKRENSHWQITMGGQTYRPAYKGSIWIDPATARVLRIESQASGFPEDFPTDDVESAMDYQYTRLGDAKQYLLPVHAENLSCQRGSDFCSHNVIDFRNYHKYSGESTITFNDTKK